MDVKLSEEGQKEWSFKCECEHANIEESAHILSPSSQKYFVHTLFEVGWSKGFPCRAAG